MGAVATREEIISKLEQLDQKELDLNLKLKDLQVQLNGMVPEEEKIKVNESLNANSKISNNYSGGGGGSVNMDDEGGKKKKNTKKEKVEKSDKGKKGKKGKKKK